MNSLKNNIRHIVDKRSNRVLVITRPPLRARTLLLERSLAAFTDRGYVESCILRGVRELKGSFGISRKSVGVTPALIQIVKAENKATIDRAFTKLVDTYVLQEAPPLKISVDNNFKYKKEQGEKERIKAIKSLIKTTSQVIDSQHTIEKIKLMLNLKSSNITITRGSELDERESIVHQYAVISRYLAGNQREGERVPADEKAIIAEFKKIPENEQQRMYETLKKAYFSLD